MTTEKTYNFEGVDSEGFISIRWHIDDVHEAYDGLTDEQAAQVLVAVRESHDANHGVCWDTLSDMAEDMFGEQETENV